MWRRVLLPAVAFAAAFASDRPDLSGTWQLDTAHSQIADPKLKAEVLAIRQKEDSIEISESITDTAGKSKTIAIACGTSGETCDVRTGIREQVTFWYNGPALVMTEMRHGNDWVVKRRLKPSPDGKALTVEIVHVAPPGQKDETLAFTKQ